MIVILLFIFSSLISVLFFFFFQAEDGIRDLTVTGVQTCALPVIGMAHRGRLNVLVNLLGKSPAALFSEFEGAYDPGRLKRSGDVKYHKSFSADPRTHHGHVATAPAFNPCHLEVVAPVMDSTVR